MRNGIAQQIPMKFRGSLDSNKLENPEEMEKFLGTNKPPKLNQDDINCGKRFIMSSEIEAVLFCQK
jgi:hypothetical protein